MASWGLPRRVWGRQPPVLSSVLARAATPGDLVAAREQMALSLGWHIVLACFGVGLPGLTAFAEWRGIRTGNPAYTLLARRWAKAMGVLFAVGAVSGTILSFEMGLLWPGLMGTYGQVIGLPFALEGFAFFIEAIFVGIYLYGWDRLPPPYPPADRRTGGGLRCRVGVLRGVRQRLDEPAAGLRTGRWESHRGAARGRRCSTRPPRPRRST